MKDVVKLEMNSLRPEPKKQPERVECDISVVLQPLRLNVDQLAIDFLITFFSSFIEAEDDGNGQAAEENKESVEETESVSDSSPSSAIDAVTVLRPKMDDEEPSSKSKPSGNDADIYFQKFSISELTVCVDYHPRRVDFDRLRNGDYSQFVHMFPLHQVQVGLQPFEIQGCEGWDACFVELAKFWAMDFATHQSHKYVAGIQPGLWMGWDED